jgi:regulator of sigma E protease
MLAVLVFIVILGVLIFVHELGHFLTAKRNGIRADEFGFGFPPRIFGIQFLSGKERQKIREIEKIEIETVDIKNSSGEILKETITEEISEKNITVPVKKWRWIWGNKDGDDTQEKKDLGEAHEKHFLGGTVYSLNWIMLGGFVKIKGENGGNKNDPDSFSGKSAWVRIEVLAAGVLMNFFLAWILISLALWMGAPEAVNSSTANANSKILVSDVVAETPANIAGLKTGDEILKTQTNGEETIRIENIKSFQDYIGANLGNKINLDIKRGNKEISINIVPRINAPEGQGALGITLAETSIVKYPWYKAVWMGLTTTLNLIWMILVALVDIIRNLFLGKGVGADVAGPVGIAYLTKEVTGLGLVYVMQFAALLSINLGIINILPFPALDGGRILFVLIEKIKGRPVSAKLEQSFHTIGFILLIILLVLITFKDVFRLVK